MDGKTLTKQLYDMLNEDVDTSIFYDLRTGYEYLNQAATELTNITRSLTGDVTLTTEADLKTYNLPANFVEPALRDAEGDFFAKYSDGTTTSAIKLASEEDVVYDDNTTSIARPSRFFIEDFELTTGTLSSTCTTTDATAGSAGSTTLTDTAGGFIANTVSSGDVIHNTTDGSTGYILSVTSATILEAALFDGTLNYFTSADSYSITLQPRLRVVLDPPPSEDGDTVTINGYIRSPSPVYSDYNTFGIKAQFTSALVKYAAWLYKSQDRAPDESDRLYIYFDRQMRIHKDKAAASKGKKGFRVITKVPR